MSGKRRSKKAGKGCPAVENQVSDNEDANSEELDFSDDEGIVVDGIRIPSAVKPTCSFDPTGPRLIITKIVDDFFKSYADDEVVGPFHKYFNAIAGPNGSGKSNVTDSVLFVLGYRGTKIRPKNVSALIHKSEKYRNVQSGTVSVYFAAIIDQEGDEYEIVPGSDFVLSRTANRDNTSYYELNGKKVQFKEVITLFKKYGIDLDCNRFFIVQGHVEQIAMMKYKAENEDEPGFLEYLEDSIGTTRYKKPLAQLLEKVEKLSELRMEKLNKMTSILQELNQLKAPMEEARGFLKIENKIAYCKNILYQKQICNLAKDLEKADQERNVVLEAQKEIVEKLNKLSEDKSEKYKILKTESERYENLQKKKESLTEAFNKANNKDIQLQETMMQMNKTLKKTKEMVIDEKKNLEKLGKVPEDSRKGIEECKAKEAEMLTKEEKFQEEKMALLANIRVETKALQEKKETLQNDLIVLRKTLDETKSAFRLAETELKIYVSNEENEKSKLEYMKSLCDNTKTTIKERSQQINTLKKKIPATEKSLKEATKELNQVKNTESELINEIQSKSLYLEECRSSVQASTSHRKVLDSLMEQKREGNCPGFYGRLGDLGAVDQKYDVAISTACDPLDNIVVDTVDTAEWCIEFLKKYDLGRATFMALDRQAHLRGLANSRIKTPENVPRLFDLVQVQDKDVRAAFYYALRDTLVANDLDQAYRIAYGSKRFPVVTLDGELIDTTGTMSGGGDTVSTGRMGESVSVSDVDTKELENLEQSVQQMTQQVDELRQKQTSLEDQINTLERELRQMRFNYEKFTMELKALKQQQPKLEKQFKKQEAKSEATKADPVQVKKLTEVVERKRLAYEEAAQAAGALQAQVDEVTKEIKAKTTGKIKAIDKNIKEITKTIDKCSAEITRLRVAVTIAERNAKKSAQKIAMMEQEVTDRENELQEMKDQRAEIEQDAAKVVTCIEETTEQLTDVERACLEIKKEIAELTKEENKLKSEKVDIDETLKTRTKAWDQYKDAIHQIEVKIEQLELHAIPKEKVEKLKRFSQEELEEKNVEDVEKELQEAENHLNASKPNLNAIQDYRKRQQTFVEISQELEGCTQKREVMKKIYDKLKDQRREEFMSGYIMIRSKLKELYQMLTFGGDADFEMVDKHDPFTEGIRLNVRPPKRSWSQVSNLSGGEKSLTSLALLFALHAYKPSPLYVMDEIDNALDWRNVSIISHYIKQRADNAQFIVTSLKTPIFEQCDNLVGVYKRFNCSHSLTIDPRIYDRTTSVPSDDDANREVDNEGEVDKGDRVKKDNKESSKTTPSTAADEVDQENLEISETALYADEDGVVLSDLAVGLNITAEDKSN